MVRRYFILCIIVFTSSLSAEAQSCFARISLDKKNVYVQQPFKVTITVLTATWYTAPLDFDNIQIPNAFVLPFDQTTPGMHDVGDKQYAGLTFYFIVFPYKEGSFTIPAIKIVATTPPEGSSESRKVSIQTQQQHFTVRPLPENISHENLMVAKNIFVRERWNKPLHDLKVGDIVERTIIVDARGTLPQFIPPLSTDTLSFASVYPHDQELTDTRDDYDANGRSVQSTTYLLEKEGKFTIPAVTIHGWNPLTRRSYTRQAPAQTIRIQPNNNLGIVTSIRDSLTSQQPVKTIQTKHEGPRMILGIIWYWFLAYAISLLVVLYIIIRWSIWVTRSVKTRRALYKESEAYWFERLMHSPDVLGEFWRRMYQWWDHVDMKGKSSAIRESAAIYNDAELSEMLEGINELLYGSQRRDAKSPKKSMTLKFRKWLLANKVSVDGPKISEMQREYTQT